MLPLQDRDRRVVLDGAVGKRCESEDRRALTRPRAAKVGLIKGQLQPCGVGDMNLRRVNDLGPRRGVRDKARIHIDRRSISN